MSLQQEQKKNLFMYKNKTEKEFDSINKIEISVKISFDSVKRIIKKVFLKKI